MNWPLPQDFNEAIQNSAINFADPDLKHGLPVVGPTGLPLPLSGNFADVYQFRGPDGRDWAVKCFTRPVFGLETRYAKVAEALTWANLPFGVTFQYLSEGIRVRGEWHPAVKMEWVEGVLLNEVVMENASRPQVLAALFQMWVKLCRRLRELNIAHADLQHGNVILVPEPRTGKFGLKLIDYDGMYVPALADRPSGEAGHPNYQHPARVTGKVYSPDLDRFPHLVIGTALKALEFSGPDLWNRYDNGDNLLFASHDFKNPSESPLMRELWESGQPPVQVMVARLAVACVRSIPETPWLDQVAPEGEPLELDDDMIREAAAILTPVPAVVVPATVVAPEIVQAELVQASPARAEPEPVVDRPSRRKPAVRDWDDDDDDRRDLDRDEEKKSHAIQVGVGIAVGLLLLCGLPIGGVLIFSKKKPPPETTQTTTPTTPTNPSRPPIIPGIDPPITKRPVSDPTELKPRWSVAGVNQGVANPTLTIHSQGETVFLAGGTTPGFHAFDLRTGTQRGGFGGLQSARVGGLSLLDGTGVATYIVNAPEIQVWDAKTGQFTGRVQAPPIPPSPGVGSSVKVHLTSNARSVMIARNTPFRPRGPEIPLCVFDLQDKKSRTYSWQGGEVYFTADSSRMLTFDHGGRFRWYRLPGGEPDVNWTVMVESPGRPPRLGGMSDDGRVIGYCGLGKPGTPTHYKTRLIDGETGADIRVFDQLEYDLTVPPAVSGGGRLAAVKRSPAVSRNTTSIDIMEIASGTPMYRVAVPSPHLVTWALSQDGRALAVFDTPMRTMHLFDVPVGP